MYCGVGAHLLTVFLQRPAVSHFFRNQLSRQHKARKAICQMLQITAIAQDQASEEIHFNQQIAVVNTLRLFYLLVAH